MFEPIKDLVIRYTSSSSHMQSNSDFEIAIHFLSNQKYNTSQNQLSVVVVEKRRHQSATEAVSEEVLKPEACNFI